MQGRPRRPNRQPRRANDQANTTRNQPFSSQTSSPRPPPTFNPVPSYSSLSPGTSVSIILKQDQPTGRQVRGIIAELLTRGDHPRGVKVRLRDGRVGRVQALVSEEEGFRGEEEVGGQDANLDRNGEGERSERGRESGRGGRGRFRHVQDVREDEYVWDENRSQNLGTYFSGLDALEARDVEDRAWTSNEPNAVPDRQTEMATCPVCGNFEGDERAVAHHVETHFADT